MGETSTSPNSDNKSGNRDSAVNKKAKKVSVTFRFNRKFELYLGRKMIEFQPNETKVLDESDVNHSDFKNQEKYFIIQEVK